MRNKIFKLWCKIKNFKNILYRTKLKENEHELYKLKKIYLWINLRCNNVFLEEICSEFYLAINWQVLICFCSLLI